MSDGLKNDNWLCDSGRVLHHVYSAGFDTGRADGYHRHKQTLFAYLWRHHLDALVEEAELADHTVHGIAAGLHTRLENLRLAGQERREERGTRVSQRVT